MNKQINKEINKQNHKPKHFRVFLLISNQILNQTQQLIRILILNLVFILMPITSLTFSTSAFAILTIKLTQGISGAVPIAIEPFSLEKMTSMPQALPDIITSDLQNSGRFKVYGTGDIKNVNYILKGNIKALSSDSYKVSFRLLDSIDRKAPEHAVLAKSYVLPAKDMRSVAHHISDVIYQYVTGIRGIFSTKIAYILIQKNSADRGDFINPDGNNSSKRYILEVADQDGYNPRPLLNSPEPIMSPAWSPNGNKIAYVSFENKQASIYIQNVVTGARYRLSDFPGINGAPTWSPDGKKLALVLSKSGSPNIYVMDIATRKLKQITNDFYINTEPCFSPNGKLLVFTSNRSGGPQIYQANLKTGAQSKLSYDGNYNARASYTWDGKHLAMIHRVNGIYNIALLDLENGLTRVLNERAGDSTSPSLAPNGTMILFDTFSGNRSVLGMVSADGSIQLVLPDRMGEAQDPAWSPFLS